MRNPVISIVTTASLIASQLAVPALGQTRPAPSTGPEILPVPSLPGEPVTRPTPPRPGWGGPSIQPPRPGNDFARTVRCESRNNATQRCNVRTENRVELQRVIGGRCSKGRDWGFTANQIWVSGGCRADFSYGYGYDNGGGYPTPLPQPVGDYAGTVRCESRNNKIQRCNVRTENRVELQRVIGGRCSKGRDWGFTANQIWVSGGCRADFAYGYNNGGGYPTPLPQPVGDYAGTIRCESRNNRYEQCNVRTENRVELVRRLGGTCNNGRQWGYTSSYVWVNSGCRAEFGYGYGSSRPDKDKDKGPSTGLIIGGIVVAGGLLALLASKKKKPETASEPATDVEETVTTPTYPAGPPATLSANLSSLPSAARTSVQNCLNDAARQIGVTGGTRLSYDRLVNLEQGNGGWRIRAAMTATYPDGNRTLEMYCRATPSQIIQLDFS